MKCQEAYALIQDAIDGRLSVSKKESLERHRVGCARCDAELGSYQTLANRLNAMKLEAAPRGLADRVILGLRATGRIVDPAALQRVPLPWLRTRMRVTIAAATVCLVALAMFPATIRPLTGIAGKGAIVVTDAYLVVQNANVLGGVVDNLEKNLRTLKTVLQVGFSLIATVGEIFMLPALAVLILLSLGVGWYARVIHRGSTGHASYSF